jgi:Trk K+ transport system NAD-binding subunit
MPAWEAAESTEELKEALLHDDRSLSLFIGREVQTREMIGKSLRELQLPEGCLVTWLHRSNEVIVPRGSTVLEEGDRITVIGDPAAMRQFRSSFTAETRRATMRGMSALRRKI